VDMSDASTCAVTAGPSPANYDLVVTIMTPAALAGAKLRPSPRTEDEGIAKAWPTYWQGAEPDLANR